MSYPVLKRLSIKVLREPQIASGGGQGGGAGPSFEKLFAGWASVAGRLLRVDRCGDGFQMSGGGRGAVGLAGGVGVGGLEILAREVVGAQLGAGLGGLRERCRVGLEKSEFLWLRLQGWRLHAGGKRECVEVLGRGSELDRAGAGEL